MNAVFWLKLYLLTIPVFFAIDMIWLGYATRNFYKNQLLHLLSPEVIWPAAFLFYFVYIVGIPFLQSARGLRPGLSPGPVCSEHFSAFSPMPPMILPTWQPYVTGRLPWSWSILPGVRCSALWSAADHI